MASETADLDGLFRLPLDEFTAARNALAARLKSAGRAPEAAHVKALPRPPISAWAVNQLYWRDRKAFDRLIAAGSRLRRAQASQLRGKGGDLKQVLDERRRALADLTRRAAAVLREAEHAASPDVMRRITTTLEALGIDGGGTARQAPGRLTADIDPPGFEALASLVPRQGGGTRRGSAPRVIPFTSVPARRKQPEKVDKKALARAASAALIAAERALAEARRAAAHAETALKTAAAKAKGRERKKDALAARLEKAAAESDAARQDARQVASQAEEAAQAVTDAERALEDARRAKKSFTN
ncbi:MAG: hypothetical protein A3F70_10620 [Acidobacteria bacterium RIFCSPLOWO2_12_FULL_67_14]|nr:MAG: hypothetical protein A3H29_09545 [Acidobacteria bacterium RIFCSPLOWO2_02_FULL_67_21]OFW35154.1 MAG: hypothetical protein A3F70_10620 [Acidobacteria bacterium RIFCSPLOWO2_12_FULL_67_14]